MKTKEINDRLLKMASPALDVLENAVKHEGLDINSRISAAESILTLLCTVISPPKTGEEFAARKMWESEK